MAIFNNLLYVYQRVSGSTLVLSHMAGKPANFLWTSKWNIHRTQWWISSTPCLIARGYHFVCFMVAICSYQSEYILLRPNLVTKCGFMFLFIFLGNYPKMAKKIMWSLRWLSSRPIFRWSRPVKLLGFFWKPLPAARAGREWEDQRWKAGRADLSGNGWRLARYIYRYLGHLVVVKMKGFDCSHIIN